ncbi:MAG TPA: TIGR02147 family protein [Bdellovibrionota bacterium]|nr:TIGR02147 family protein [Bdellovibrionota bacterium]
MTTPELFDYSDYRKYVRDRIKGLPKGGHGQYRRIAHELKMHTTHVSQVFSGRKHLSAEQGTKLASFLALSELETLYFLTLLEFDRAGTQDLKGVKRRMLNEIRDRAKRLSTRLPHDKQLTETEQGVFYSDWVYSAARLATSLPGMKTADAISTELGLPRAKVAKIIEFLLQSGLCVRSSDGLEMGPKRIHVSAESPFVVQHHRNWRLLTGTRANRVTSDELMFTGPMTLSSTDFGEVRKELVRSIETVLKRVNTSKPKHLACLNIDWLKLI